jgi:hypothetical protein
MKKGHKRPIGRFLFIILILLLLLAGFFVGPIRALSNDILIGGLLSVLVMSAITGAFYLLTVWLVGAHVLPAHPRDKQEKRAARQIFLRFAFRMPVAMAVVRDGEVLPGPDGEARTDYSGIGVIDVDSTSAVSLMTSVGPSRIKGTGLIFTHEEERLGRVLDLRIQFRTREFEYLTRDGIAVKVRVTARFQLDHVDFVKNLHAHEPGAPFPRPIVWTPQGIRRALAKLQIAPGGGPLTLWSDLPLLYAGAVMRRLISEYNFDDLYAPLEPSREPRIEIRKELDRRLRLLLLRSGVKLKSINVGAFAPADFDMEQAFNRDKPKLDKITEQRVKAWKAKWESVALRLNGEAQAEAQRRHEAARAQARLETILRLTQAIEQNLPEDEGQEQDQITTRFWQVIRKMAEEPNTRALLAQDNLRLLMEVTRALEPPEQQESPGPYGLPPAA